MFKDIKRHICPIQKRLVEKILPFCYNQLTMNVVTNRDHSWSDTTEI